MITEAIILGGGLARRMGNSEHAKWFTPLGNGKMTIAGYQLNWLKKNGIERIHVTLSSRFHLPRDCPKGYKVIWEPEPIGDEGGLKNAMQYVESDDVLVVNCDVLTDLDISALVSPTMVAVHPRSPWGVLEIAPEAIQENILWQKDGHRWQLTEKPVLDIWINAGIYLLPKAIKEELVDDGEIARHILPKLLADKRLNVLYYEGIWHAVETLKDADDEKINRLIIGT